MEKININGIDEVIYKHTCKNGFEIYMWKYDLSDEISMSLTVKYGSVHTSFKKDGKDIKVPNGIAHFLEHIKFNEEDGTTANDFYSKIGSYANAYTSYDNTSYEVTTTRDVKTNLNHLLYYVFNPYFKEELIEKEKGIIKEEANGSINNAYANGYHKLLENIYKENPRRYLITGTPEDVESITLEDVLNVYNNFYVPGNMFLTIGGNIDPDEVVSIVEDFFKDKTYDKFDVEVIMPKEDLPVLKTSDIIHDNVSKNKMYLAYKYDRKLFKQDDFIIKMAFNRILTANFGTISDFKEELTSKKIIDELGSAVIGDDENVVVIFEVSADDLEKVRKLIDNKMNNLSLDKETFDRIKKVKIASLILGYDRPSGVVYNITRDLLEYDKILNDIKDLQENSKLEDVLEVIKLLDNTNYTYLEIIPKKCA